MAVRHHIRPRGHAAIGRSGGRHDNPLRLVRPDGPAGPGRPAARAPRLVELARAGWGAGLLIAPDRVSALVRGVTPDDRARAVIRVLGARQLLQGVLSAASPTPAVLAVGVWVDGLHALSGVLFAAVDRRRARPVLLDAGLAAALAAVGRRLHARQPPLARGGLERSARVLLTLLPGSTRRASGAAS